MKRLITLWLCALLALTASAQKNIYKFSVTDGTGKSIKLKRYKGKVLLIVNTATHCGFTPQYAELESIYKKYKQQGFEILDFPCNQFGWQAPGSYAAIHQWCTETYGITFDQYQKINVIGSKAHPLYTYMVAQKPFKGFNLNSATGRYLDATFREVDANYAKKPDVKWNFTMFLINHEGHVMDRFEPSTSMQEVESGIEAALKLKAQDED